MAGRPIEHVILDVDDVLVVMEGATRAAEQALRAALDAALGADVGRAVHEGFARGYATLRAQLHRPPGAPAEGYEALRARIDGWQTGLVQAGHAPKEWSRDVLIAIALEDAGVTPEREALQALSDRYWEVQAGASALYPDAVALIGALRARGISFHLATNSDGFLSLAPGGRTFTYAPDDAAERKWRRLRVLSDLGIVRAEVTVGDPVGKPEAAFFERVLTEHAARMGRPVDRARTLAVGDSLGSDVLPLLAIGVQQGAWLVRGPARPADAGTPGVRVVADLLEVVARLEDADAP